MLHVTRSLVPLLPGQSPHIRASPLPYNLLRDQSISLCPLLARFWPPTDPEIMHCCSAWSARSAAPKRSPHHSQCHDVTGTARLLDLDVHIEALGSCTKLVCRNSNGNRRCLRKEVYLDAAGIPHCAGAITVPHRASEVTRVTIQNIRYFEYPCNLRPRSNAGREASVLTAPFLPTVQSLLSPPARFRFCQPHFQTSIKWYCWLTLVVEKGPTYPLLDSWLTLATSFSANSPFNFAIV